MNDITIGDAPAAPVCSSVACHGMGGSLLLSSKHYPEQDAAQDNGQEHVKDRPFYAHRDRRHPHKPTGVAKARRAKKRKK